MVVSEQPLIFVFMTNKEIVHNLNLLSKLMEIYGENSFKTKAYSNAAYRIGKESAAIETRDLVQNPIPEIGASVSQKIQELLQTGKIEVLEEYLKKTPAGVVDMLQIKGIGPKKIAMLWQEIGIESIGELAYACTENRLVSIKGFGAKSQESILKSIEFIQSNNGYYLFSELHTLSTELITQLKIQFPQNEIEVTGAIRRQILVANEIELLTDLSKESILTYFSTEDTEIEPTALGINIQQKNFPKLNIQFSTKATFSKDLFLSTNTPDFNISFLEQYSLPEKIQNEAEIFEQNKIHFIHPALRESRDNLKKYAIPLTENQTELIQNQDIKGIIHSHSTYSDGINTLEEMANAAIEKGYEYLVISDHSQVAGYANGLYPDRIIKQHKEIGSLNQKLAPFKIFKSIEADILNDGNLDYNPEVLASFDLVIASIHSNLKMTEDKAMMRLMNAIQNPFTTILGHPTGRLLLSRAGYPIDYKTIIDACSVHKVVIEINAHPRRLDLDWEWIPYALEKGVLLSIDPDAHSISGIDLIKYGVYAAQKGGLTKKDNLSSMSLQEFENYILSKKQA